MDREKLALELGRSLDGLTDEEVEAVEMEWINGMIAGVRAEMRLEREKRVAEVGLEAFEREQTQWLEFEGIARAERLKAAGR